MTDLPERAIALRVVIVLLAASCAGGGCTPGPRRFESPEHGFSILVPPGWHEYPGESMAESRRNLIIKDELAREAIEEGLHASLISFAKYAPPSPGQAPDPGRGILNPSIEIDYQRAIEMAGTMPVEILTILTEGYQRALDGYRVIEPAREIDVSGFQAAYVKFAYVLTVRDGRSTGALARQWIIPRGEGIISIHMIGPSEGGDVCEEEFRAAANSIRLEW